MRRRYIYVSNAFEESIRQRRMIETDSPAASLKVGRICKAVKNKGADIWILSLGRGRQRGTYLWHRATIRRQGRVPIVYADFYEMPLVTHLVTAFSITIIAYKITRRHKKRSGVFIFYNCVLHYVPLLIQAWLLKNKTILDLEDGYCNNGSFISIIKDRLVYCIFDRLCQGGAMLANHSLAEQISIKPQYVCYGTAPRIITRHDWGEPKIKILLSGALMYETGADVLINTIKAMIKESLSDLDEVTFIVTGFGPLADCFKRLAVIAPSSILEYYGKISEAEYRAIISQCHVGLCLKRPDNMMGLTTFPSKVVDIAANGLLLVTTKVSDVPMIFSNDSAVLLDSLSEKSLIEAIKFIISKKDYAHRVARQGQETIYHQLNPMKVGEDLLNLWNYEH